MNGKADDKSDCKTIWNGKNLAGANGWMIGTAKNERRANKMAKEYIIGMTKPTHFMILSFV